jgi:Uma2 family endonuclease
MLTLVAQNGEFLAMRLAGQTHDRWNIPVAPDLHDTGRALELKPVCPDAFVSAIPAEILGRPL